MIEVWKSIIGYETLYEISNFGRVKSLARYVSNSTKNGGRKLDFIKEKILKTRIAKNGYYIVALSKNGKGKKYYLHRLIAIHFIDNPNQYPVINHKNCDQLNNNLENLEWVTQQRNIEHGFDMDRNFHGKKHYNAKLTEQQVLEIRKRLDTEDISQRKLAKEYGVSFTTIRKIHIRKHWRRL